MKEASVDVEDEDFLSQLAAVEADAISAKRRKIITTTTTTATTTANAAFATATANANSSIEKANGENEAEGAYLAALRGSRSLLFQQQFTAAAVGSLTNSRSIGRVKALVADNNNAFATPESAGGGGGTCFKCGKSGHWARDCDSNSYGVDPLVPEKACLCGLGACIVLTANTDKNRGRKFYKCPHREENGGCGFFEWCDKSSGADNMTIRSQSYTLNPSLPELSCPCGAGSCLILTAKTGKNIGQQFYRCPANQGSCGFFKWCNNQTIAAGRSDSANASKVYKNIHEMNSKNSGTSSGSPCFSCGKDGHWTKDCPQSSIHSPANFGGKCDRSNTCYKCGKPGHWAKDCNSGENVRVRPRR